jgi:hypothetical protein
MREAVRVACVQAEPVVFESQAFIVAPCHFQTRHT